jgi:Uncharacterized protein conserved in bacteria (DUF2252)
METTHTQTTRVGKVRHLRAADARRSAPKVKVFEARPIDEVDFRAAGESWERRVARGRALRDTTPRADHGAWTPAKGRPDPVEIVHASGAGRQKHLLPLRHARMAASPFGFLRGGAAVMA